MRGLEAKITGAAPQHRDAGLGHCTAPQHRFALHRRRRGSRRSGLV